MTTSTIFYAWIKHIEIDTILCECVAFGALDAGYF
jgi:hypothetical protein